MSAELNQKKEYWDTLKDGNMEKFGSMKSWRIRGHFEKIKNSDAILVLNYDKNGVKNYVGPNTLMEIAVAFEHGKKIFVLNPPESGNVAYEELSSVKTICLNGDLGNLR